MTCETCQAWDARDDRPGFGICRRCRPNPEMLVATVDDGEQVIQVFTAWPETAAAEWCLEHVARQGAPLPEHPPRPE